MSSSLQALLKIRGSNLYKYIQIMRSWFCFVRDEMIPELNKIKIHVAASKGFEIKFKATQTKKNDFLIFILGCCQSSIYR